LIVRASAHNGVIEKATTHSNNNIPNIHLLLLSCLFITYSSLLLLNKIITP